MRDLVARPRTFALRALGLLLAIGLPAALGVPVSCTSAGETSSSPPVDSGPFDPTGPFCALPGSVVYTQGSMFVVPGGPSAPDLTWLHVPEGFCVHAYAPIPNARQIRFAPGGELFVASPTQLTTGGGPFGLAWIAVLPDDDGDGFADSAHPFLTGLPSTQGLLFTGGFFYYQDGPAIRRMSYQRGQRVAAAPGEVVANITLYKSLVHWPKTLDVADDGTIYVGNGGDQDEVCDPSRPFHGGILRLDGTPGGTPVARGLRNPISLRCQKGRGRCFATELNLDYSAAAGGREKIFEVHPGDDWGYPCCGSTNVPYAGVSPPPDCSKTASEDTAFLIGDTPFGLEFEPGDWPEPWRGVAFVTLHGAFASWAGARVIAIRTDPATGKLLPSTDLTGTSSGAMRDFATGWDDGSRTHGRPAGLAMSPDGRLFLANDAAGEIVWIAPIDARPKAKPTADGGEP